MSTTILRYKYVPIDDSFKAPFEKKGSLSIIKDGTIRFSHPKIFNDPFDCYPDIDEKAISKAYEQDKEFFKKLGRRLNLSPAQRIQEKPKQLKKLETAPHSTDILNNEVGICSLSRNPLNLLMWAHYATSHTGFVVEFSIPTESTLPVSDIMLKMLLVPFPVDYQEEKPIVTSRGSFDKHFLTKGKTWEYEEEERVIDFIRKAGDHPYDRKRILKSVIAGMRMSDDDFAVLKNTVNEVNKELGINVTVHKAESSKVKGKFALFVPDRDDLNIHNN